MNITADAPHCQSWAAFGAVTLVTPDSLQTVTCGNYYTRVVNTFLPYPSFKRSAHVLDRARLGKQRVEVLQLLRALHGETKGWVNHPAAVMWRGHEAALCNYGLYVCDEWIARGYQDTCRDKIRAYFPFARPTPAKQMQAVGLLPWWFGWRAFHNSHKSNLMRKDPVWYNDQFGGDEFFQFRDDLPYVWPHETKGEYHTKHAAGSIYSSTPRPGRTGTRIGE